MTTATPAPRPRSFTAAMWLHESFLRDAQRITAPDARAAAVAQVHIDHPKPDRTTYRRTR